MVDTSKKKILVFILISLTLAGFALPVQAQTATLHFLPPSGTVTVGSNLILKVLVSSPDQSINAASGIITFPTDKLELVSLTKSSAVFNLWVQEPSFSNAAGTINFEGVALNPGYTGNNGEILIINFRAKAAGTAPLEFSSGSVLANNGQGTNILGSSPGGSFTISGGGAAPRPTAARAAEAEGLPPLPIISSPTHPNSDGWYANKTPFFKWVVPEGVTAARLLVSKRTDAAPTVTYEPAISSRELLDLDLKDGVLYFHARFRNAVGWGPVAHFKFQIDTEPPQFFDLVEKPRIDATDPQLRFQLKAADALSGIGRYEILINGKEAAILDGAAEIEYKTDPLFPGDYTLAAKALDRAGNFLEKTVEFTVEGLEPPVITNYQAKISPKDLLLVEGTTYSESTVVIYVEPAEAEAQSYSGASDSQGNFSLTLKEPLAVGDYQLWAEVVDKNGAKSPSSEKRKIAVTEKPLEFLFETNAALLMMIIVVLLVMIYYCYHHYLEFKNKVVKKENKLAVKVVDELKKGLAVLERKDKKKLTEEEEKLLRILRKIIKEFDKFYE